MCKVTHYVCDCCEKLFDRLWSECHCAPQDIYACMNLDTRVSRAMYCESCDEALRFPVKKPKPKPRWYQYLADPHLLITKWREFTAQRKARREALIEQLKKIAQEREYIAHRNVAEKVHPKIYERARRKSIEKKDIAAREHEAFLASLDEAERDAFFEAQREAQREAYEKWIIDQRKFKAMLEEFERGW